MSCSIDEYKRDKEILNSCGKDFIVDDVYLEYLDSKIQEAKDRLLVKEMAAELYQKNKTEDRYEKISSGIKKKRNKTTNLTPCKKKRRKR